MRPLMTPLQAVCGVGLDLLFAVVAVVEVPIEMGVKACSTFVSESAQ